jgi:glycogen debranching enzyme
MAGKLQSACAPLDDSRASGGGHRLPVVGRRRGLQVVVGPRESREYILTNKNKAYFAGETGTTTTRSYAGLIVELHKFLEGWDLLLGDTPLSRWGVKSACVLPQSMTREHIAEGTVETVFLADDLNVLILSFATNHRGRAAFVPRIDIRSIWEERRPEYEVHCDHERCVLALRRVDHPERTKADDYPVWVAIACDREAEFVALASYTQTVYTKDAARRAMGSAAPFSPGRIEFSFDGDEHFAANVTFAVAVADDFEEAVALARRAIADEFTLYDIKMRRVSEVLDRLGVMAYDGDYRYALQWAAASIDGLIMNQMGRGIFAGLHWFPNYWGRDTFISLPGACLVRGEFGAAREILEVFAGMQDTSESSPTYGRIPNLAMPGEIYYNTADGTWWFIREALEYVRYTGDREFARGILPAVERAIDGASRRLDERGFLRHGQAETWMDAGGESHPYSPRGDRAVEIEALWYTALRSGAALARACRRSRLASRWDDAADALRKAFTDAFWDAERGGLYDHIDSDGSPDRQLRPNQIFAVTVPWDELLRPEQRERVTRLVGDTCVLPHGVTSLAPSDPNFHGRHLDLERYHYDEAYHNGDVWVWLTGPVVSAFVRQGLVERAWEQTAVLTGLFFEEGAAGTLPELRNGVPPRSGENVGGAVSQAWSLAEFLRNFYQDYLGVAPDLVEGVLALRPALPAGLPWVRAPIHLGPGSLNLFYEIADGGERGRFRVSADRSLPALRVLLEAPVPLSGGPRADAVRCEARLDPGATLEFVIARRDDGWRAEVVRVETRAKAGGAES